MTPEILMLIYSTLLYFVWILVHAGAGIRENGIKFQMGPRDNEAEPSAYRQRAKRLCDNMQENLLIFAILVLSAHALDVHTDLTELGAQLFFFARVIHGFIYLMGWKQGRPLAWFTGVIGMGIITAGIFIG